MSMRDNWRHQHRWRNRHKGDKTIFGLVIALIGVLFLLKTLHIYFFSFAYTWPFILILIGLVIGIKSRFYNHAWWILMLIGAAHLIPEFEIMETSSRRLVWPIALIFGGLFIAIRSRKKKYLPGNMNTITSSDSFLNLDVAFGGRKEIVTSKDFKGGNISATFAGAEVNLMQADSTTQPIILDIRVSFGGVELIVPSHWEVQSEISPAFGSVEDHRVIRTPNAGEERKILSIKGSCSFGSIEIKSY